MGSEMCIRDRMVLTGAAVAVYLVLYFISLAKGRGSKKIRRRY